MSLLFSAAVEAADCPGYLDAAYYNGAFIAVGTGGRADVISLDKEREALSLSTQEDLLTVCTQGDVVLVGGRNGALLYSTDGRRFEPCSTAAAGDILCTAATDGLYLAGSERGMIYTSSDGLHWNPLQLPTDGDIISAAASEHRQILITKETDVFTSTDGRNWTHLNFNSEYEGYYDPLSFSQVFNLGSVFLVVGRARDSDSGPVLLFTEDGDVWIPWGLIMINGEPFDPSLQLEIRDLSCDSLYILAICSGGRLLKISDCVSCHQLFDIAEAELTAIASGGGKQLVVGADFYFDLIISEALQHVLSVEEARELLAWSAVLIDVRSEEERRKQGFIPHSLHIPIGEIQSRLSAEVLDPNTALIFYCSGGGRSQQAVEFALELGYTSAYNLGGMENWRVMTGD